MCNKTQTTTGKSNLPGYLEAQYKGLLNAGKQAAARPLVTYNKPTVAGFTPEQNQAFQMTQQNVGNWTPFLNNASSMVSGAYNSLQAPNYGSTIAQFQNPYTQRVVDTTMANINRNNAVQQNQLLGQGIANGVSPNLGDRTGVASAELARNQALAGDQTMASLEQQGYTNAQGAAQQAAGFGLQGAGSMAGLGQQAQGQTNTDASNLLTQGSLQQQLGQQQLTNAYNQFQQQQQYPQQQIDWLASLAYGQPRGGTTSTTQPGPSLLSQLAGAATAGAGVYSTLFPNQQQKRGGPVHMDAGGTPPAAPTGTDITGPQLDPAMHSAAVTGNYDAVNGLAPIPPSHEYWSDPRNPWVSWSGAAHEPFSNAKNRMDPVWNPMVSLSKIPTWPLDPHQLEANQPPGKFKFFPYAAGGLAHMDDGGVPPDFDSEVGPAEGDEGGPGSLYAPPPPPPTQPSAYPTQDSPQSLGAGPAKPYGGFFTSKGFPLIAAGLGMMGDTSPWPLTAIGRGALKGLEVPEEFAKQQTDLDAKPVIDTSSGTIRIKYASDPNWHDSGIPTPDYQKWEIEKPVFQGAYGQAANDINSPGATRGEGTSNPIALKAEGYDDSTIQAVRATGHGPNSDEVRNYLKIHGLGAENAIPGAYTNAVSADLNDKAQAENQAATSMLATNKAIQNLLPYARQGFAAGTFGGAQKIFASLGLTGVTQATAYDTLNNLIKKEFQEARDLGSGSGNGIQVRNQREFGYLTTANADLDNMPGANQIIVQGLNKQANLVKTLSEKQLAYATLRPGAIMDGVRKTGDVGNLDPGWRQIQRATVDANPIMDDKTIIQSMVSSAGQRSPTGQPMGVAPAKVPRVPTPQEIQNAKKDISAKVNPSDPIAVANAEMWFNSVYGAGAAHNYLGMP